MFPSVDPIPLPAPIWLMKLLSLVTLALHFSAVMLLVGSLLLVCWHNFFGRSRQDSDQISASFVLARRLPVIMTYVINLGIPPLLFAQVLYGRALYSSSILIAVMWFAVILLVMLDYWLLYRIGPAIEAHRSGWGLALVALLITLGIGQIYAMNMTLMLRPEVWQQMYAHSPMGLQGVHGDPTTTPRWLFVMAGGPVFGGLWALTLSNMGHVSNGVKRYLRRSGGLLTLLGALAQIACGLLVTARQPEAVRQGLASHALYNISGLLFVATILVTALLAAAQGARAVSSVPLATVGLLTGFLSVAASVIYRDGIRDLTLLQKGYNVWNRVEYSNWSVIGLFLLLFVIMLVIIVWLLNVMRQATAPIEQVTQP
jgi:hypothetical protein